MVGWSARRVRAPAALAVALVLTASCGTGSPEPTQRSTDRPSTSTTPSGPPNLSAAASPAEQVERAAPLIVIDPGHSGKAIRSTTGQGLRDIDYPNYPEIYEMFDVSVCVAEALTADGYRVQLTKSRALSSVSHTERAAVANDNHAALAISVHDDHGVGARFQHTYDQRGTRRRDGSYPEMYRGTGRHRMVYAHPDVATTSQRYALAIAKARTKAQQRQVTVTQNSYDGRAPLEPGNLALVQLFSEVPWVYNEMGALTAGRTTQAMSIASETGYAKGLVAGVAAAVPLVPGRANPTSDSADRLEDCLMRQVEPEPGRLTRPKRYLPYRFG